MLRFLILGIITISQCQGNVIDREDIKKAFSEVLDFKLSEIKDVQSNIGNLIQNLENDSNDGYINNIDFLENIEAPAPCLNLLRATDHPCPDLPAVLEQMKKVFGDTTTLVIAATKTFHDTFNNPEYSCPMTINPISALRCFLRAFRASYDNLRTLKDEVLKLENDGKKLYEEYIEYKRNCQKNQSQTNLLHKAKLLDLCQKVHTLNAKKMILTNHQP